MTETNQTQKPSPMGVIIGAVLTVIFAAVGIYWRMEIGGTKLLFNDSSVARLYRYYWLMLLLGLLSAAVTVILYARLRREKAKYDAEHTTPTESTPTESAATESAAAGTSVPEPIATDHPELTQPKAPEQPKDDNSPRCPACRNVIEPGTKFCTHCGHKLS